jgi:hypothetical protein
LIPAAALWLSLLMAIPLAAGSSLAQPESAVPTEGEMDSLLARFGEDTASVKLADPTVRGARPVGDLPGRHPSIRVGERLTFSVRYGMIRAGEATMEVVGVEDAFGHPSYHVVSRARSNGVFDTIYRVRDIVESWMDVDYLFSRRFRKALREGNYRADQDIEMDQENRLARYQDGRVFEFVHGAMDVLSAFYYVRTLDLKVGQDLMLDSHADRKNYPLKVIVRGRERVSTPAGRFDCLVVEPMLRTPGLFKHEGKLTIWLTDDDRRMPVLMKSKIPVGSISVTMTGFKRP